MGKLQENIQFFKNGFKEMFKDVLSGEKERFQRQIPNLFTLSRGTLAPLTILPTLLSGNLLLAGILTGIFATTDFCDGFFARKYHSFSEFGRHLDPVCDKIFAISLTLPLLAVFPLHIIPILILEGVIASINVSSKLKGYSPKTKIIGKVKTFALFSTIALSYVATVIPQLFLWMDKIFYGCIALQIASSLEYYQALKKEDKKNLVKEEVIPEVEVKEVNEVKEENNELEKEFVISPITSYEVKDKQKRLTLK